MLQADQVLQDRYQLKCKLGQNPRRQTWLADDLGVSPTESVVVKFLAFGGEVQWDDLKLFEREGQILKHLNHPQIPKYRDYFHIDDRLLWFGLVQEYIPGISLKEQLESGKRFTEAEIRKIALDILKILGFLHHLNPAVLHRDIKPSNLIWGEDGQIYLVDFGAVQDRVHQEGTTFTVVGTYGYTPMEQFGGRAVPASDLYALGATLIHLLTGTPPGDLPQQNLRIAFEERVTLTPRMVSWIQTLIEPAPEQRFKSAEQARKALVTGKRAKKTARRNASPKPFPTQSGLAVNNSGQGNIFDESVPVPPEIKGWNWGAFLLSPFWPLSNKVWIGLLTWVVGWPVAILLGIKGNEWAWKSRRWESIEQFKSHQRGWAIAAFSLLGLIMVTVILGL